MGVVRVGLKERGYDIVIAADLSGQIADFVRERKYSSRALVIADSNTAPLYGERLLGVLKAAGLEAVLHIVAAGETSKNLSTLNDIYTRAIEERLDRKSPIFALGGGVVGDLAGFAAATYMRGVPFVQIPTTLLAQVDSSVGGKTAVNHLLGKNLIGAFYQPEVVFIDLEMLETLPKREISTGLGEIIKYGVIADAEMFAYLERNTDSLLSLEQDAVEYVVGRSCEIKADVVGKDERESGLRRILNFGHTLAHAVEQETNYTRYNHGEAVALGMLGAARLSRLQGLTDEASEARLLRLVENLRLPLVAEGCTLERMSQAILHDKKTVGGKVNWVLMRGIGDVLVTSDVSPDNVTSAMKSILP